MNAKIKYRLDYRSSDLMPQKLRESGAQAWVIQRVVVDQRDVAISADDVAIFNFDSEATLFQRFIFDSGLVEISPDLREHFELVDKALAKRSHP